MAFVIVLAVLAVVAAYGAWQPDQLWFQHYAGRVAQARKTSPGDPERAFRRRVYLVTTAICLGLLVLAVWAMWQGSQPVRPS